MSPAALEDEPEERAAIAQESSPSNDDSWRDGLARTKNGGHVAPTLANLCVLLTNLYAGKLAFDVMAQRPILDGEPLTDRRITEIRYRLSRDEGVEFAKEVTIDAIAMVGGAREVHPVREYLNACRSKWDGASRLNNAAKTLLEVTDKLSGIMVKRTLVAAVARAFDPGCQVDSILILVGPQGAKKSTFFRVLGGAWFGDSKVDITDRKGQMVMASKWIYEWPECDRVFAKHSDSDIKAFVTQRTDDFVPMYGRAVQTVPRSWIAVGTTNKDKFLTDATGDRRSWVVDLRGKSPNWKVDARTVESLRDQLFGEAVAEVEAYHRERRAGIPDDQNPHRWFLSDAEETERAERTADFRVEKPWAETIGRWLAGEDIPCPACQGGVRGPCGQCAGERRVRRTSLRRDAAGVEYVTQAVVLSEALGIPLERHNAHGSIVAETLASLGWRPGNRIRPDGAGGPRITPYYRDPSVPGPTPIVETPRLDAYVRATETGGAAPWDDSAEGDAYDDRYAA